MEGVFNRVLNLRSGDFARGWPFFLYYFFTIASYSMGQVARDALFLDRFKAVQLPYADMALAALVGVCVAFYMRLSRRTGIKNLLIICLLFFASNALVFWWAAHYSTWVWLFPILYVWVGIFGVLATMQVWALANFVWTTREARRLFSLLGSGGILGGIFAGFFSNFVAKRFGTESLLIIVAVFILLCAVLVEVIWRGRESGRSDETPEEAGAPASLRQSLRIIQSSSLLQTIAVLICLSSIVTTAAGWQLKAVAKDVLVQKDALAAFFGSFYGYTGVLSLAAQLLITPRLLKHFGVGAALFILPASLMAGSAGVLISGSLVAATLFKGTDKVLRYSVDTSAMQLLYLPIPLKLKFPAKSFIDTVVWRLGDGLAGFSLLIFATTLHFTPRQIGWLNVLVLAAWIATASVARRQYFATLTSTIQHPGREADRTSRAVTDAMAGVTPADLDHPMPSVRAKTVAALNSATDNTARGKVASLLGDEDLDVRSEALLYMTRHGHIDPLEHIQDGGDVADYSVRSGIVSFLAKSGDPEFLESAAVILEAMLHEKGSQGRRVRKEAARLIASTPGLRKRAFVSPLIEELRDRSIRKDASLALLAFGESVTGTLSDYLADPFVAIEIRRQIPVILVRIGTPEVMHILVNNILQADNILRYRIISSLNKLRDRNPEVRIDTALVETVIVAEVMGLYRSYQILASIGDGSAQGDGLTDPLKQSMKEDLERIFRLMKILTPGMDLQSAYLSLQSKDPVIHANALEFLDNALRPQLRSLIVPLIDGDISVGERVLIANKVLGINIPTQKEAVAALMGAEDPWLKSCAEMWTSSVLPS